MSLRDQVLGCLYVSLCVLLLVDFKGLSITLLKLLVLAIVLPGLRPPLVDFLVNLYRLIHPSRFVEESSEVLLQALTCQC